MTKDFLLSAIGDIDDDLIAEAAVIPPARRIPLWVKYAVAAACICLCTVAVLSFPGFMKCGSMAPESANDMAIMDTSSTSSGKTQDTVYGTLMEGVSFLFYDEAGEMSALWWDYPDGIVSTEEILNAYLREAGCDIACLSVVRETEGEQDTIYDYGGESVIEHKVGITTVTVTLDGTPQEHILRGLGETVRGMGLGYVKVVSIHADGQKIWHGEW